MAKTLIIGWVITEAAAVIGLGGYFAAGHLSLVDWQAHIPWTHVLACLIPMYWPPQR